MNSIVSNPCSVQAILFDKDGTLFDFNATWTLFCERMFDCLVGNDQTLRTELAAVCGYNAATQDFIPGSLMVAGSAEQINNAWADLLGVSAEQVLALNREILHGLPVQPVCDLSALFAELQGLDMSLGVATNDLEQGALTQLAAAGVEAELSSVFGSDSGFGAKPDPGMVHEFCRRLGVTPQQVAMVGDSRDDLRCASAAGVGLRIGVLTGPATAADLNADADLLIDSIAALPSLLKITDGKSQYPADSPEPVYDPVPPTSES